MEAMFFLMDDLAIKNGDFPVRYVSLPKDTSHLGSG